MAEQSAIMGALDVKVRDEALTALPNRVRALLPSHLTPEAFCVKRDAIERKLRRLGRRMH